MIGCLALSFLFGFEARVKGVGIRSGEKSYKSPVVIQIPLNALTKFYFIDFVRI